MHARELRKIIAGEAGKLSVHLNALKEKPLEKEIHHFRVTVKKIRAVLRLIYRHHKNSQHIILPPEITELYHYFGNIRDKQLTAQKIKDYFSTAAITSYSQSFSKLPSSKDYQKIISEKSGIGSALDKIKVPDHKLTIDSIARYIQHQLNKAEELLKTNPGDKEIHEARKKIKDVLYIILVLSSHLNGLSKKSNHFRSLEDLVTHLGTYNDWCRSLDIVNPTEIRKLDENEQFQFFKMRRTWQGQKRKLKKQILFTTSVLNWRKFEIQ